MNTAHEIVVAALDRHPHELMEVAPLHVYGWGSNKSVLIRTYELSPHRFMVTMFYTGGEDSVEGRNDWQETFSASPEHLTAILDLLAEGTL